MAKHRNLKRQKMRRALSTAAATVAISGAMTLVAGTGAVGTFVELAANSTVIGIGGRDDPTSARIPAKLSGTLVPIGATYKPILYPASLDLGGSRDAGVGPLNDAINQSATNTLVSVVGYSEGSLVAEQERRNLQALGAGAAPAAGDLRFTQIASPFAGNGGVFGRLSYVPTFFIIDNMGSAEPTRYDTDYVAREYDTYADFPAYLNPLSIANSLLAVLYAHPDVYYDTIQPGVTRQLGTTKTVKNAAGGTDTYTIYYTDELPLLVPLRQLFAQIGITPIAEPVLRLLEPEIRVLVDMGYTDRTNADPATHTPLSVITPPAKIIEALQATPGALQEGVNDAIGIPVINPLSVPSAGTTPSASRVNPVSALFREPANTTTATSAGSQASGSSAGPTVVAGSTGTAGSSPGGSAGSGGSTSGKTVAGGATNTGGTHGQSPADAGSSAPAA